MDSTTDVGSLLVVQLVAIDGFLCQVIFFQSQTATFIHIGISVHYNPITGIWRLSMP